MNSLNKILPIVAVVAAIGAAIVPAHKSGAQSSGTSYYWFDANGDYTGIQGTSVTANSNLNCGPAGNRTCALGFSSNQLEDPTHPEYGLADNVTNNDAGETLTKQ